MAQKLFVWDFHGTLEKDNILAVHEFIRRVLAYYKIKKIVSLEEVSFLYGQSWIDYFRYIHPEGTLEEWREMKKRVGAIQLSDHVIEKYIKPMDYANEVLCQITEAEHINIVLSNTEPKWLRKFTQMVGLEKFFNDYVALDAHDTARQETDIHDIKSKAILNYLSNKTYNKIICIGDRESDIKAGKAVKATTYYLRNKFNKGHILNLKPDYEINDLREVLREL